jgi:uncharacterized membrane protein
MWWRRLFGVVFTLAGVLHFVRPRMYEAIMPDYLPAHRELVYASGLAEIAGGLATLHPATRRAGSWWSIATLVAVFPANVDMAIHADQYPDIPGGAAALYARLPLQALVIAWAYAAGKDDSD